MNDAPVLVLPDRNNSDGDLDERSRSTDSNDWPVFSDSQINVWDRCQWAWHLGYRRRWSAVRQHQSMNVGLIVHEGLDVYYGNNNGSWEAVETWMKDFLLNIKTADDIIEAKRASSVLARYCETYARTQDIGYEFMSTELHMSAPFKTSTGRNYWIQAYSDALVKFDYQYELWDHKSGAFGGGFWTERECQMHPQTPRYIGILRETTPYYPRFSVINMLNTYDYKKFDQVANEKLFKRIKTPRSDIEIDTAILQFGKAVDELIDRYKTPRKSPGKSCTSCQFQEVCYLHNRGVDIKPILIQKFKKRDDGREESTRVKTSA